MIYFDNAATTYKKPLSVKLATLAGLKVANPGRSGHSLSQKSAREISNTRLKIQNFFNVPRQDDVIFTNNCTEALNMAILGLNKTGNVIASTFEHNSVLRPLHALEKEGKISLSIATPQSDNIITSKDIEPLIKEDTFLICVSYINNTLGNKNDIESIGKLCKQKNIILLVDCAQAAGHIDIDMQRDNINILTAAGHKGFFAPQSIGVLCLNNCNLNAIKYGGTGTNSYDLDMPDFNPEKLESGTLSSPLIYGLSAGVSYVNKNFIKHNKKIAKLTHYLYDHLKQLGATIYTNKQSEYGVILFNFEGFDSTELTSILDEEYSIMVRGGLHCAAYAHRYLKTLKTGAVRISLNHYNSKRQIDLLISALNNILYK